MALRLAAVESLAVITLLFPLVTFVTLYFANYFFLLLVNVILNKRLPLIGTFGCPLSMCRATRTEVTFMPW